MSGQNKQSVELHTWFRMMKRCYNPKDPKYDNYGGRGITVCQRWRGKHGYGHFLEDMGKRPGPSYSLDRIDNDKGYFPDNCRWADRHTQQNNTRLNVHVQWEGRDYTVGNLVHELGLTGSNQVYIHRLRSGWSVRDTFTIPIDHGHKLGQSSWSKHLKTHGMPTSMPTGANFSDTGQHLTTFTKRKSLENLGSGA